MANSEVPHVVYPRERPARGFAQAALGMFGTFMRMLRDPRYRFPTRFKVLGVVALTYVISPIDIIPDFLPLIGVVDDLGLVALVLSMLSGEVRAYEDKARRNFE